MGQLTVDLLRSLLRNLESFRALRESEGIDTIPTPDGDEVNLWDLEAMLEFTLPRLPDRQRQAIELVLIQNCLEKQAAIVMGVSETNPVAMYASEGLKKIIVFVEEGQVCSPLSRYEEA